MTEPQPLTILCLASYEKGHDFLRQCKEQGCHVVLLTTQALQEAGWPRDSVDETLAVADMADRAEVQSVVSRYARERVIDRIVALEDYDVEVAAAMREHLRVPGMGDTTARLFRDKLAMRVQARSRGLPVPPFVHALNRGQVSEFVERVPGPWVLKPRSETAAVGIQKIGESGELWPALDMLGDRQADFLLEKFIEGDVYHVDAIAYERQLFLEEKHRYGTAPMQVAHHGGVSTSRTIPRDSQEARALRTLHREVLMSLNFVRGVTHTEFILGRDGVFYFLETAARVGGAYLAQMVEAATGINLWREWAKIEIAGDGGNYSLPTRRSDYAGIIVSLARQQQPDMSQYNDPEVVWRLDKDHHAGLVVASSDPDRVKEILEQYTTRFYTDFFASEPLPDKPT